MAKEKTVNYTREQEQRLFDFYNPAATQAEREKQVAELAAEMNKSPRSIIAKLTTMNRYVAKAYQTKNGEAPRSKQVIVAAIAKNIGANVEVVESLEKATKKALTLLETATRVAAEITAESSQNMEA